jgi:hypothetical protein
MRWKATPARQPIDFVATSSNQIFGLLAVNRQSGRNSKMRLRPGWRPHIRSPSLASQTLDDRLLDNLLLGY